MTDREVVALNDRVRRHLRSVADANVGGPVQLERALAMLTAHQPAAGTHGDECLGCRDGLEHGATWPCAVIDALLATEPRPRPPMPCGAGRGHRRPQRRRGVRQIVRFHRRHLAAVLDGSKTTTVRWGEKFSAGPALLEFDAIESLPAQIVGVREQGSDVITAADAGAPAGTDMGRYVAQLQENYYPMMPDVADLTVVRFRLEQPGTDTGVSPQR